MDLKQQILHYYRVDEMSLREIARRTGADRKTVPRLLDAVEAAITADPDMGIDEFLATLLQKEVDQRYEHRKYTRIHKAGFPQIKYLAELVREDLPADGRNLLPEFETLDFIRSGRNIVMYGNPGPGTRRRSSPPILHSPAGRKSSRIRSFALPWLTGFATKPSWSI